MILLSTLNIIGLLINGNSFSWLWNVNLTHEKLDWDRKWLPDFSAGKTQLVSFDRSNNCGAIDEKKDCSVLDEKLSFTILYLCLVNWTAVFMFSLLTELTLRNWSLIHSTKFLSSEVLLYFYKSTILLCMGYYHLAWANAPNCYLDMFDFCGSSSRFSYGLYDFSITVPRC